MSETKKTTEYKSLDPVAFVFGRLLRLARRWREVDAQPPDLLTF
jgi:hypothetical protein